MGARPRAVPSSVATALALVLVGASLLGAQEGEKKVTPPGTESQETPEPPAPNEIVVPDVVVPDAPASLWTLGFDVQSHWDSNLRFTANPEDIMSERANVTLTHAKRSSRGTMALSASTFGSVYHGKSGLNSVNYSGATTGSYDLAPRTKFRSGLLVASTYSPESSFLGGEGLILPLSRAFTVSGTGGLVQRLGARTSAGVDARYDRVRFTEVEGGPVGLPGGETLLLSAFIAPQVSPHDSLNLGYQFQRSDSSGSANGDTQSISLGWSRLLGRRFSANASGGASHFKLLGNSSANPGWTFRGDAALSARFRRSSLVARYERGIDQAFGFGRDRLADVVTASYGVTASRKVRLSAAGTYGLTRDPVDPLFRFNTQSAEADMSIAVSRRIDLSTGYVFRRNRTDGVPDVIGHAFTVSLGYSREWRP
jgi:hypothetical protein